MRNKDNIVTLSIYKSNKNPCQHFWLRVFFCFTEERTAFHEIKVGFTQYEMKELSQCNLIVSAMQIDLIVSRVYSKRRKNS